MLILSRTIGTSIIIGHKTKITVLAIKGNQVRVGIDAPDDISVHREEIYNKILRILKKKGTVTFSEITNERDDEMLRIFMSVLHLSNKQKLKLKQEKMFDEIFISGA